MSRVALIGENSIQYVSTLIDIWNKDDCAVLIDWRIPPKTGLKMMLEASVGKCYIERELFEKKYSLLDSNVEFVLFEKTSNVADILPEKVYKKYHENYCKKEALVIYSSGTTGRSRGIILSHYAINTNADAIIEYMTPTINDCIYITKTLSHSSTITGELLVALKTNTAVVISPVILHPRCLLNNISKYSVSIIAMNPMLISLCSREYMKNTYDISTLKKIYVSGEILTDKLYRMIHATFYEQEIYNVYGLTEAGPRVTAQRSDCCNRNTVGKALNGVSVVIVDAVGNILTDAKRGMVHVKTPSKYSGYIIGKEKHISLYEDYMNTGDIGYFNEFEELIIVGRIDDVIVINAHKIYPKEIEDIILYYPDVCECAVIKCKINNCDTLCCIYTVNNAKTIIKSDFFRDILLPYEIPKLFYRCDSIPRTINGKIKKSQIIKLLRHLHETEKVLK